VTPAATDAHRTRTAPWSPELSEPRPPAGRWWWRLVPSVGPGLLMLLVGAVGLTRPALGWDEHATWSAAVRTPWQILALARNMDGVIAPYYLVMHYWTAVFGDSLTALRLPSLLAVATGVGLAGEWGRRLWGGGVGLTGALILATVPQLSRAAQEARAYGLAFCFAVLATLLLHVAATRPTWSRWLAYGAAVTVLSYVQLMGLLVLTGHLVAVVLRHRAGGDNRLLRVLPTIAAALLVVSPLVWFGVAQRGTQLAWIAPMDLHTVVVAPGAIFAAPTAGLFITGLAFTARGRCPDRRTVRPVTELAVLAVLPPALLITVSFLTAPLWVPRYVMWVTVPVALLAAVALGTPRRPGPGAWRTVAALAVIALLSLEAHRAVRGPAAHGGMDFRRAAAIIEAGQRTGDAVVYGRVGTWSLRAGLAYELRNTSSPSDVLLRRPAGEAGGLDGVECPTTTCFDTRRVWYVGARRDGDPMADAGVDLRAKLSAEYRRTGLWLLPLGTIALYERR
jgi:mannosyltransferase